MTAPKTLGRAGRQLLAWIEKGFEVEGCEPMIVHLCQLQDRLALVRGDLAKAGLSIPDRDKLIVTEIRLVGAFTRTWRAVGLGDNDETPSRPVGRPPDSERTWRK